MKQTSKQNKNRDVEINNKLTVTRREREGVMGKKGKGHQRTCVKDKWTKPKGVGSRVGCGDGWGEGLWWGENGDNCTKKDSENNIKNKDKCKC